MSFRVTLPEYLGPVDLLLYLVRHHELDVLDVPVAAVVEQFLKYLGNASRLDVDEVGEFLAVASTLMEMKACAAIPTEEDMEEPEIVDQQRRQLVLRLLEYRQFKDAAELLDERSRQWRDRYPRLAATPHDRDREMADQPIKELQIWDLVSAFGRLIQEHQVTETNIVQDETPIHVYAERLHERIIRENRLAFSLILEGVSSKSIVVSYFLALLELVRHGQVAIHQNELHGEIWLLPGDRLARDFFPRDLIAG